MDSLVEVLVSVAARMGLIALWRVGPWSPSGMELTSPTLQAGFSTARLPGKSLEGF